MARVHKIAYFDLKAHGDLDVNKLEVEVRYNDGSYHGKRGYYLSVNPVKVEGMYSTYVGFSGKRMLIQETRRFSQKTLEQMETVLFNNKSDLQRVIGAVCLEHKLEILANDYPIPFISYQPEQDHGTDTEAS